MNSLAQLVARLRVDLDGGDHFRKVSIGVHDSGAPRGGIRLWGIRRNICGRNADAFDFNEIFDEVDFSFDRALSPNHRHDQHQ
ncbi:MAG: hypothetical protein FJW26_13885 [Acidimicrobiia bacterium]|nr:hypothetical protein [Acidimicrobiia bacterium]